MISVIGLLNNSKIVFMRPNISNCHALPGTLIIFEGADGSGKTTQIQVLRKLLEKEGKKVTISSWKSAPILGDFLKANEALKKKSTNVSFLRPISSSSQQISSTASNVRSSLR